MREADIHDTATGRVPAGEGWFIANLAELSWETAPGGGTWCLFEAPDAPSPTLGIGMHVLAPGEPSAMYHAESEQEGFLVLAGECVAIVEGEERRMSAWDYLHCPPGTAHITVGAGSGPCAILMVGTRSPDATVHYPVDGAAAHYGASVAAATGSPAEAYARRPPTTPTRAPWPLR
jgi:quercetin dioxygenase-like cupin family protein